MYLCGRAGFTVVVTLFTVVKCIVGGEPTEAYGPDLSFGFAFGPLEILVSNLHVKEQRLR